jgi:hypothetical protein
MKVLHCLVGYDKKTDRAKVRFAIADRLLGDAKRIAKVPEDDPEAVWSYPLTPEQVRKMGNLIGANLELEKSEFFLEAFTDANPQDRAERRAR